MYLRRMDEGDGDDGTSNLYGRILSTFLNELDGISSGSYLDTVASSSRSAPVLILVACTSLESLDEALVRPGRLQYHVALEHPTEKDVEDLLETCTRFVPVMRVMSSDKPQCSDVVDDAVDFHELSSILMRRVSRPLTCSDIESICREAVMAAIRENISDCTSTDNLALESDDSNCFVCRRHFLSSIESVLS